MHPNNKSEWTIIRWVQNKGPYSHSIKPWNSLLQSTVDANKEKHTCSVQKTQNKKSTKVYRKIFSLNKDMPCDPEPQLAGNWEHTERISLYDCPVFLFFVRHSLLATITDKILSYVDLWSHSVQSVPFVLCTKHFHWYNTMFLSEYLLFTQHRPTIDFVIHVMHIMMLHIKFFFFKKKSQIKVLINFELVANHDRFSSIFH